MGHSNMRNIGTRIHITGAKEAMTKAGNIRPAALANLRKATLARGKLGEARFQSEMGAAYNSPYAHNQVGKSIRAKVKNEKDGVSVQFTALGGDRDHIRYITGMLPDSEWKEFPRGPFPIIATEKKALRIRYPGHVRTFIQSPITGQMEGSKYPSVFFVGKSVMWGSKTGGFSRDVLAEVSQSEGQSFASDMYAAVAEAISQSTD